MVHGLRWQSRKEHPTMTMKIRALVVSGVCLVASACTESTPSIATDVHEPTSRSAPASAVSDRLAARQPAALSATVPSAPSTILDGPKKKAQQELLPAAPEAPKASDAVGKGTAGLLEPHDEPVDYGRPLAAAEVKVARFVLAKGVEGREPLAESDVFTTETPKIFAFVELANPDGDPYAFRVHWEALEGPASPYGVELHVETAPRFRTWSWTAIRREPGKYRAVLRTLDGEEIASRTFVIEPAPAE
jgi:hypothetical protein